jgi:hypothetical protein
MGDDCEALGASSGNIEQGPTASLASTAILATWNL